jgi:hypothetical protein
MHHLSKCWAQTCLSCGGCVHPSPSPLHISAASGHALSPVRCLSVRMFGLAWRVFAWQQGPGFGLGWYVLWFGRQPSPCCTSHCSVPPHTGAGVAGTLHLHTAPPLQRQCLATQQGRHFPRSCRCSTMLPVSYHQLSCCVAAFCVCWVSGCTCLLLLLPWLAPRNGSLPLSHSYLVVGCWAECFLDVKQHLVHVPHATCWLPTFSSLDWQPASPLGCWLHCPIIFGRPPPPRAHSPGLLIALWYAAAVI